jgi:hypothetical protein
MTSHLRVHFIMPIFRKRPTDFASPVGTKPCSAQGCTNMTAITCAYRDRRGRSCSVAFCRQHWSLVGGVVYCRRHAGTIVALGDQTEAAALPELENRGPSLVSWVADDLTADIEELLRATARDGEAVKTEHEVKVIFDHRHRRRWERSWKLIERTGISFKVALTVDEEEDDALVDVRVESTVIARGVPPWIARRRAGLSVVGQVDQDQRELFHRFFINHIAEEIATRRTDTSLIA